jgi:hypothetical protein
MGKRGTSADLLQRSRPTYGAGVALAAIDGGAGAHPPAKPAVHHVPRDGVYPGSGAAEGSVNASPNSRDLRIRQIVVGVRRRTVKRIPAPCFRTPRAKHLLCMLARPEHGYSSEHDDGNVL